MSERSGEASAPGPGSTRCARSLMLKATHPEGGAAAGSAENSYMEKRGSWRVISKTWN